MKHYTEGNLREVTSDRFEIELNMPKEYPAIKARATEDGGVRDRFFASVSELPREITVVRPYNVNGFKDNGVIYVAEDGCDRAEGSPSAPVATLKEALSRAEGKGGVKIVLKGGYYDIDETLNVTGAHSGTAECPTVITSEEGSTAYISASRRIPASAFREVTDKSVLQRLSPSVRGKVLEADLASLGITDYGNISRSGARLIVNGAFMDLARYPNAGERPLGLTQDIYDDGIDAETGGHKTWEMRLPDMRPLGWQESDDIYMYGGITVEYNWRYYRVAAFNRDRVSVIGAPLRHHRMVYDPYSKFFFENVFEELDVPGEWYLDRRCGKLYLYPPKETLTDSDDIRFLVGSCDLIHCSGAENVIFDRLDLGRCGGRAIKAENCRQVLIQRCHVTATRASGGHDSFESAVELLGGYRNGVIATSFEYFSGGACRVGGGDRKHLIPANNFIQNCTLENPRCRFGTFSSGCGNLISHNYLHNTTMNDAGSNESVFEYNILEGGDNEAHDTGMIYVGGGGLSSCANHYRYNYFFDFAEGDYGIYFDDMSRGMYAYGNIVVGNGTTGDGTTWYSGGRGYNHHNGGEHVFYNNISIDAGYFAFGGDVSYWNSDGAWFSMTEGIQNAADGMRDSSIYFDRNPTYRDFVKWFDRYLEDVKDPLYEIKSGEAERRLRSPWCNHYENNLIVRAARPFKLDHGEETATGLDTNFITDGDPGFADFDGRDYRFRGDAPVYGKIQDFTPPPFEKMGPVNDFENLQL